MSGTGNDTGKRRRVAERRRRVTLPALASAKTEQVGVSFAGRSDAFDNDRRRHSAGGAHGYQATFEVPPLQFVENGPDQD